MQRSSASAHEKAHARAGRVDRTFFMRHAGRTTYVRASMPFEFEEWGPGTHTRQPYVVVQRVNDQHVKVPFFAKQDPDQDEATALGIFQFCIDVGRAHAADPNSVSGVVSMTPEEARKYTIVGQGSMILANNPDMDSDVLVRVLADRYDRRHKMGGSARG